MLDKSNMRSRIRVDLLRLFTGNVLRACHQSIGCIPFLYFDRFRATFAAEARQWCARMCCCALFVPLSPPWFILIYAGFAAVLYNRFLVVVEARERNRKWSFGEGKIHP